MRATANLAAGALALSTTAFAGPPFLTDDPEPTNTGRWEIYAPAFDMAGRGSDAGGAFGAEINYGAAKDVQLTVGIPVSLNHDAGGWHAGAGDLEASAKYRFYKGAANGVQAAFFPGVTLPTARHGFGAGRVTVLLPVWVQKDWDEWTAFGGGGYALNPGPGNRDYWSGGFAVAHKFGESDLVGIELDRDGPSEQGGRASTSLGIGAIKAIGGPFRVLASGGPTFDDGGGKAGFHMFAALGIDM